MIYTFQREAYIKRIPTVIDRTYEIQTYDIDNLYPQRADEVRNRSYTTKSAVDVLANFIEGEGWQDPTFANLVLNSDGMVGNDILNSVAVDRAPFTGFALHFAYNANYKIAEITPVDFMFCRLGLPDRMGNVAHVKVNCNWERDPYKGIERAYEVYTYPVFNPDPVVVKAQMEQYGGFFNYPGQILYWTPKAGVYPKASFDAVFDNAQTQAEIGVFELASIQNGFTAATVFKYPGKFETDEKRTAFLNKMSQHKGARGAKSTLVVETDGQDIGELVETIQMQNTDKMFEFTSKNVKNAIRESMMTPAALIGQLPESGMFNQQQMVDSYNYFNAFTSNHRQQLTRVFKKIMAFWKDPVQIQTFDIAPKRYLAQGAPAASSNGTPNGQPAPANNGSTTTDFNNNLAGLTGKQYQNLLRIIRDITKGKMTRQQGVTMLKISYGFSDEQANSLLTDVEDGDIDL